MYIAASEISHLGHQSGAAYGLSYRAGPKPKLSLAGPTGWVVSCSLHDNYYGFYTYEADAVVLVDNEVHENVVYGLDPHDRSNRLIIANNHAHHNGKHGIIISREVNDRSETGRWRAGFTP